MFEFIRTHQRLMMILLLLVIFPPFVFFGIQNYLGNVGNDSSVIAKIGGESITQPEWDQAQRQQMERFRRMMGSQFDPKLFDTPAAKQEILDNLIAQHVLAIEARKERLSVSDRMLQQTIASFPGLQTADGRFDYARYKALLAAQNMTPTAYENSLRQEMAMQQINAAIQATAFAPKSLAVRLSELNEQQREVEQLLFKPVDYLPQVKVTDDMVKAYYDGTHRFDVPAKVTAQYVVLTPDALASQVNVTDADIKSYYDQNINHFRTEEQRRASHILIAVKKNATAAEQAAAEAKAEKVLAEVRAHPDDFAKLAKKYSDDTGTASNGGDLGFFSHGMMVKPFEDAVFKLKVGEISGLVRSEFGYHIIKLTAVKPAASKPLSAVKDQIADEIRKQMLKQKYSEAADIFSDTVYEQSGSLQPVADKLKLKIQTVANLTNEPDRSLAANVPYNNAKFLHDLFSNDALRNKRNTDAVQVAPNMLIAGHVVAYQPATKRPFAEVKNEARRLLMEKEAIALAKKAGEAKLAALMKKDDPAGFSPPQIISRAKSQDVDPAVFLTAMKADASKLPAFAGADLGDRGYSVLRIVKVEQPTTVDQAKRDAERQQITDALGQQEAQAYIDYLKKKIGVKILHPLNPKPASID